MSLYQIIKSLQDADGSNAKLAILQANTNNELLRAYLKATYDPALSYYMKNAPVPQKTMKDNLLEPGLATIECLVNFIAGRKITGNAAKDEVLNYMEYFGENGQELIRLLISRSVGAGVGDTMVLKAFPGLFFTVPYMRCSLLDEKSKKHFSKLKRIFVQKKADGAFLYLVKEGTLTGDDKGYTRKGTTYPKWFVERLLNGISNDDAGVFVGEALVVENGKQLDRKTGNGILNSILDGADEIEFGQYDFIMEAWDHLTQNEFEAGYSARPYEDRFNAISEILNDKYAVRVIQTDIVSSLKEAVAISFKYAQDGFEGGVIKDPTSPWKDHTSPFNVKVKVKFEAEYIITGIFEGQGKYKGMMGGVNAATSDGLLESDFGTGFDDKQRKEFWKLGPDYMVGKIMTGSANDVITKRGSDIVSLFLPVFEELRLDKTVADDLPRVYAQLEAAKRGELV